MHDFDALPVKDYCYLLGLYLGDGCISKKMNRVWKLRISLDKKYPGIIDSCRAAIDAVMPRQHASVDWQPQGCAVVGLYSKHWPCLFPQHGPGLKHRRPIKLEPWQLQLVEQATEDFVRGLIHSDGCRVIANDRGVTSIRYHFTNHSEDILGLFTDASIGSTSPPGRDRPNTSSPSTARRPPRASTNSSDPSAEHHSPVNP